MMVDSPKKWHPVSNDWMRYSPPFWLLAFSGSEEQPGSTKWASNGKKEWKSEHKMKPATNCFLVCHSSPNKENKETNSCWCVICPLLASLLPFPLRLSELVWWQVHHNCPTKHIIVARASAQRSVCFSPNFHTGWWFHPLGVSQWGCWFEIDKERRYNHQAA